MSLLSRIFGDENTKTIQKFEPVVSSVNALESAFAKLSDEELRKNAEMYDLLKRRLILGKK